MNTEDFNRALAKAESWTETVLLWVIGLPAPFTFIVLFINAVALVYIGWRLHEIAA